MTLKEFRENLQSLIDSGQRDKAEAGLKILSENDVVIKAFVESEEDKIERIKMELVKELRDKGLSPYDANSVVNNNFNSSYTKISFMEHIMKIPQVRQKMNK